MEKSRHEVRVCWHWLQWRFRCLKRRKNNARVPGLDKNRIIRIGLLVY